MAQELATIQHGEALPTRPIMLYGNAYEMHQKVPRSAVTGRTSVVWDDKMLETYESDGNLLIPTLSVWLISHQPTLHFSHNKPTTNN
jgi:hypothetical protein